MITVRTRFANTYEEYAACAAAGLLFKSIRDLDGWRECEWDRITEEDYLRHLEDRGWEETLREEALSRGGWA